MLVLFLFVFEWWVDWFKGLSCENLRILCYLCKLYSLFKLLFLSVTIALALFGLMFWFWLPLLWFEWAELLLTACFAINRIKFFTLWLDCENPKNVNAFLTSWCSGNVWLWGMICKCDSTDRVYSCICSVPLHLVCTLHIRILAKALLSI